MLSLSWSVLLPGLAAAPQGPAQPTPDVIEYPNPTAVVAVPATAVRLTLGADDGVEFHRVTAILPRLGGGFVVANSGTSELLFFDQAGRLLARAGRRGRGPGEYASIRDVAPLPGDSLAVLDPGTRRVSVLAPDGTFARSFPLQAPFEGGGAPTRMVTLPDGTVVVGYSEVHRMAPQARAVYFGQRFFRYTTNGELRSSDALALPNSEYFVQAVPPEMGGVAYWNLAFGRVMTVRPDSMSLLVGDGSEWTIERRTMDGAVRRTHRLRRPIAPVTASDRARYRDAALAGSRGPQRRVAERRVAEMPYPESKPAFRRFETDPSGRLWVETYPEESRTESLWIRLDPVRRSATAVAFPPGFRPLAFTERVAFGVWRDQDDVEHVRLFSLDSLRM